MDEQEVRDLMDAAPPPLQSAIRMANLVALAVVVRSITLVWLGQMSWTSGLLFGLLISVNLCALAVGLYVRKKYSYYLLFVFAGVPVLGLFAQAFHLVPLTMQGNLIEKSDETITGLVSLVQFLLTLYLFRYLVDSETRQFVFASAPTSPTSRGNATTIIESDS